MWSDPDYLESLRRLAVRVAVSNADPITVPLKLVTQ
jgi:hypothetical protein